jgi:hypothetical protein
MTPQETAVVEAMDVVRRQADDCVTCLYLCLTIHAVAARSRTIRHHINETTLFWNTTLRQETTVSQTTQALQPWR